MRPAGKETHWEIGRTGPEEGSDWTPHHDSHSLPHLTHLHRLSASRLETNEAKIWSSNTLRMGAPQALLVERLAPAANL